MVNKHEIQKWTTVTPKGDVVHTGCGIIVDVVDIPDHRNGYYHGATDGKLYTVLTDFGNTFIGTLQEMLGSYEVVKVEADPVARLERQRELLAKAEELYFKEL